MSGLGPVGCSLGSSRPPLLLSELSCLTCPCQPRIPSSSWDCPAPASPSGSHRYPDPTSTSSRKTSMPARCLAQLCPSPVLDASHIPFSVLLYCVLGPLWGSWVLVLLSPKHVSPCQPRKAPKRKNHSRTKQYIRPAVPAPCSLTCPGANRLAGGWHGHLSGTLTVSVQVSSRGWREEDLREVSPRTRRGGRGPASRERLGWWRPAHSQARGSQPASLMQAPVMTHHFYEQHLFRTLHKYELHS